MLTIARNLVCIFLGLIAYVFFNLGMDWLNLDIGHGIHPAIAFPIATLAVIAIWYFLSWDLPLCDCDCDDLEYIDTSPITKKK